LRTSSFAVQLAQISFVGVISFAGYRYLSLIDIWNCCGNVSMLVWKLERFGLLVKSTMCGGRASPFLFSLVCKHNDPIIGFVKSQT
jgi:hypothetical protein